MIIIKRDRITFYIKDESVIVSNNDFQFTSYNVYALQNRNPFYQFKDAILDSKPPQFNNIIDVVSLGAKFGIYGTGTAKPNIEGVECEYRQ